MNFLKNKVNDVRPSWDRKPRGQPGNLGSRSLIVDHRRSSVAFPQAVTQSSGRYKEEQAFSFLRERMGLCDKMPTTLGF
jgi:hypothetical protein